MITGSIVALVTPMNNDLSVSWDTLSNLIEFHIENGTNAIVIIGTTGESATLSHETHIKCFEYAVKVSNNRIPIIAGTGANNTVEAVNLAKAAKLAGANAHLSITPYYNKPNQRGLLAHYTEIADNCDLPMILYNVPGRTACDLKVETILELAKHKNIIGIKEASTKERCFELIEKCPDGFAVYCGEDPVNCEVINAGANGAISVTANVAPKLMSQVCEIAKTDLNKAKELDKKLSSLHTDLFIEPSPAPTKWALERMGLIENNIRLPLVTLAEESYKTVTNALAKADIII